MDICDFKNAELEPKYQKYKGRVVLRGDTVKDDSGSYAVFTEQGSSASQMTAAKVMDIISRLLGCAGQAADAVSSYTQVKMEDAHKLLKIPKSECPDIWIRLPRHKWPKSWSSLEDPVVLLERNLYGHLLAGLLWERQFEKILMQHGWEKISNWECLFVHRDKGWFLSVYVDDIKLAGKKQNIDPMWKVLNKEVDLGEPTSFLDHVYLGCTQRQCEISKDIVDNYRTMFESRISAVRVEKLPFPQNLRISSWSYDMEGHAKKCVERYCELANKTTQQLYKVSTPCIDDPRVMDVIARQLDCASSRCGISKHPSKNGGCSNITEKSKVRLSRYLDTSSTDGQNHGHTLKTQWFFSNEIYGLPHAGLSWERRFEEVLDQIGNVCLFTEIGLRGWHQNGWKKAEYGSHVEEIDEAGWLLRADIIPWLRVFGMHSTWIRIERVYYWGIQKCSNHDFLLEQLKITWVGGTSHKNRRAVTRNWRSREELRGKILRTGQQKEWEIVSKSQLHDWTIIISRKEYWRRLGNCPNTSDENSGCKSCSG